MEDVQDVHRAFPADAAQDAKERQIVGWQEAVQTLLVGSATPQMHRPPDRISKDVAAYATQGSLCRGML